MPPRGTAKGDNPARHPVVAEMVKGWRNQAPAQKQAGALTSQALTRIRETVRLPRRGRGGRMETPATARARAAVDLAIIGVLADGGLRRSEGAALTWGHVEYYEDGTARITIQRGENQPAPSTVAVTENTARALREIQPPGVDPGTPVFGLTGEALANRVRGRSQGRGPGRQLLLTQRPHRHSPADGRHRSAHRSGPASGPMEARRHGGPVHPGKGRRGGAEVADLEIWPENLVCYEAAFRQ